MSGLKEFTQERLRVTGRNPFEAAKIGGLERSFVNDILIGKKQSVRGAKITQLAEALDTSVEAVIVAMVRHPSNSSGTARNELPSEVGARIPLTAHPQKGGRPDLAVRGIALGGKEGDGDFQLNGDALDYIPRPAGLIGRPEAFAVIIRNTSMEPVYKHGWPIFVDPKGRKPVEGEDVLIELLGEGGENGPAFIKTLVARRGGQHVLSQYNPPPEELRFDSARVKNLYRVIPYPEAMGLAV
ncbi:Phage repressor protein C, contains Cro/C1-type HTH and peptisase s24 domains [Bosea thiooxidans]|uniref:Phage repressor protein C, contains Cro/C1-type HTH and peptisase s24 domains n=1 Tax=Bosea thiooxidans TaxID=53254 RepID=A0A1T5FME3_9HYPH|nr:S24 family peptidase [Bosea thiooxidans]SKB97258.1 Phage repressor protein C, contains Cro/C1-type HTH and peptisase s24 domains [Bosea thiooxidans]